MRLISYEQLFIKVTNSVKQDCLHDKYQDAPSLHKFLLYPEKNWWAVRIRNNKPVLPAVGTRPRIDTQINSRK